MISSLSQQLSSDVTQFKNFSSAQTKTFAINHRLQHCVKKNRAKAIPQCLHAANNQLAHTYSPNLSANKARSRMMFIRAWRTLRMLCMRQADSAGVRDPSSCSRGRVLKGPYIYCCGTPRMWVTRDGCNASRAIIREREYIGALQSAQKVYCSIPLPLSHLFVLLRIVLRERARKRAFFPNRIARG